jgi:hypothetical protein
VLSVRNPVGVTRDRLVWSWRNGDSSAADFGNPPADTGYVFCVYDDSNGISSLVMNLQVPAGGVCGEGRPCWRDLGDRGFTYTDRSQAEGRLLKVRLKQRGAGTAAIQVRGKGASLSLSDPVAGALFQQDPTVTVQLVNDAIPSVCWEAIYSAGGGAPPLTRFKDESD